MQLDCIQKWQHSLQHTALDTDTCNSAATDACPVQGNVLLAYIVQLSEPSVWQGPSQQETCATSHTIANEALAQHSSMLKRGPPNVNPEAHKVCGVLNSKQQESLTGAKILQNDKTTD